MYRKIQSKLRVLIFSNIFLYKIVFYARIKKKNRKLRLPRKYDSLYFDGYPRSGNTYTFGLIFRVYPSLHCEVAHHLHTIAALKMALNRNVKSLIIIRQPKDSIVSYLFYERNAFYKQPELADKFVRSYINYYGFVLKNLKRVKIINFDLFVKDERESINSLGVWAGATPQVIVDDFIFDYKKRMKNWQETQNSDLSSMPNNERKVFKSENIDRVLKSKFYPEALRVYNEIIESNSIL